MMKRAKKYIQSYHNSNPDNVDVNENATSNPVNNSGRANLAPARDLVRTNVNVLVDKLKDVVSDLFQNEEKETKPYEQIVPDTTLQVGPKYSGIEEELINCQVFYSHLLELTYKAVQKRDAERCSDLLNEWLEALSTSPLSTVHLSAGLQNIIEHFHTPEGALELSAPSILKDWIDLLLSYNLVRYPNETILLDNISTRNQFLNGADFELGKEVTMRMRPWFLRNKDHSEALISKGRIDHYID
jgi:hypothetical protein